MSLYTLAALAAVAALTGFAALFVSRLIQYRRPEDAQGGYSAAKYAPMSRLLDAEEMMFLASQPGASKAEISAFQRDRRRIFRMYLYELAADFGTMHRQAREVAAAAPAEHPELVGMLVRQQISFWIALAGVECSLALHALGVAQVNPARLLENIAELHAALLRATTPPGPIAVS